MGKTLFQRPDRLCPQPRAGIGGDEAAGKRKRAAVVSPCDQPSFNSAAQLGGGGDAVEDLVGGGSEAHVPDHESDYSMCNFQHGMD